MLVVQSNSCSLIKPLNYERNLVRFATRCSLLTCLVILPRMHNQQAQANNHADQQHNQQFLIEPEVKYKRYQFTQKKYYPKNNNRVDRRMHAQHNKRVNQPRERGKGR